MDYTTPLFTVRTSLTAPVPTKFDAESLDDMLDVWFRYAISVCTETPLCLQQLLEFLQHTSFTFHITSDIKDADTTIGSLQLLSLVYLPTPTGQPRWVQSDTQPYLNLVKTATPLLPPLVTNQYALVFLSQDKELIVWHSEHNFDNTVCLPASSVCLPWREHGASELQLSQDTADQPPPVIPAYLCETISFEGSNATFLVGNKTPLTHLVPLRVSVARLTRLFHDQPQLQSLLHSLPSSFELSIGYGPWYGLGLHWSSLLRIAAPGAPLQLFHTLSQNLVSFSPSDSNQHPWILDQIRNFLYNYFQWQELYGLCHAWGYSLQPLGAEWEVVGTPAEAPFIICWSGSEPGGIVLDLPGQYATQQFGAFNDTSLPTLNTLFQTHLHHYAHLPFSC